MRHWIDYFVARAFLLEARKRRVARAFKRGQRDGRRLAYRNPWIMAAQKSAAYENGFKEGLLE